MAHIAMKNLSDIVAKVRKNVFAKWYLCHTPEVEIIEDVHSCLSKASDKWLEQLIDEDIQLNDDAREWLIDAVLRLFVVAGIFDLEIYPYEPSKDAVKSMSIYELVATVRKCLCDMLDEDFHMKPKPEKQISYAIYMIMGWITASGRNSSKLLKSRYEELAGKPL